MKIRLVLLDLDDTLLCSTETFWKSLQFLLRDRYGDEADDVLQTVLRLVRFFGSTNYRGFFGGLCRERGLTGDDLAAELDQLCAAYKDAYAARIIPRRGAVNVLSDLRASGRTLGIVTNGRSGFQRFKLERSGLASLIDGPVLISGDYPPGFAKPSPRLFQEALKTCEVSPEEAAFVGDRTDDVIGANIAELWAIRFETPEQLSPPVALNTAEPAATITELAELGAALARIEERNEKRVSNSKHSHPEGEGE